MQWRVPHVHVLLGGWLIPEIESEGVTIVGDAVALKTVAFLLVVNSELVAVAPFVTHRLLITRQISTRHPSIPKHSLEVTEVFIYLEIWMCLVRRDMLLRVLSREAGLPLLESADGIGSKHTTEELIGVDWICIFTLELKFHLRRRIEAIEEEYVEKLLPFFSREWFEVRVLALRSHLKKSGFLI